MRPGIKKFHTAIHPVTKQISPGASLLHLCICFLISKMGTRTPHPTCFGKGPAGEKLLITRNMFSEALPTTVCSCTAKLWHETVRKVHLINALILLASQQKMCVHACMHACPFSLCHWRNHIPDWQGSSKTRSFTRPYLKQETHQQNYFLTLLQLS